MFLIYFHYPSKRPLSCSLFTSGFTRPHPCRWRVACSHQLASVSAAFPHSQPGGTRSPARQRLSARYLFGVVQRARAWSQREPFITGCLGGRACCIVARLAGSTGIV